MLGTLFVAPFAERKRRKVMLLIGIVGVGAANITLSILYIFEVDETYVLVVIALEYTFFNLGPEPIVFMLFSEMFPERYKYRLNSFGYTVNWIACILSVFMMNWFLGKNEYILYLIFAGVTLILGISGTLLCPETLNKRLPDIEQEIRQWGVKK